MMLPNTKLELKRKEAHITQEEAAKHIGVSRATLISYENGSTPIPVTTFIRLCKLYHCDTVDIFGVNSDHFEYDVPASEIYKEHFRYLVNKEREINETINGIFVPDSYYDALFKKYWDKYEKDGKII